MHVIAMFTVIATHDIFQDRLRSIMIKDFQIKRIVLEIIPLVVAANRKNFLKHEHLGTAVQSLFPKERFLK